MRCILKNVWIQVIAFCTFLISRFVSKWDEDMAEQGSGTTDLIHHNLIVNYVWPHASY